MIQSQTIKKIRSISFVLIILISVISNFYNYYINYLIKQDSTAQWRLAMISISSVMFLFSLRMWLGESLKKHNGFYIIWSGWLTLYFFINFIGVMAGYTLHTKGLMMILFSIVFFGLTHILIKLWEKYY